MGCDIHLYAEKFVNGAWRPLDKWKPTEDNPESLCTNWREAFYEGRCYDLFAILADVRNGYGFAGIKTGEGFKPIANPRGLPEDCCNEIADCAHSWGCDGHSHSYHTVKDLLDYDWTQRTGKRGMLSANDYLSYARELRYDSNAVPESWSGRVGGSTVKVIPAAEMLTKIAPFLDEYKKELPAELFGLYTELEWTVPYYLPARFFLSVTLPRLLAHAAGDYNSVRIVFWFDN